MATVRHIPLVALLAITACASGLKPGKLSPVGARVTNEVLEADQRTFNAWSDRLTATAISIAAATPERAYARARAAAWLGLARDAYAADPRDTTADHALAESGRLVLALESNAPVVMGRMAPAPVGARADLWASLDSIRSNGGISIAPVALAEVEVALVRASYMSVAQARTSVPRTGATLVRNVSTAEQPCDAQSLLTRAEQLLMNLRGSAGQSASLSTLVPLPGQSAQDFTVRLAGEPTPVAAPVAPKAPVAMPKAIAAPVRSIDGSSGATDDTLTPMQIVVHFEPMSRAITADSKVALDEVVVALRSRRPARIVFERYLGNRAIEEFDRDLADRRSASVRQYLADAKLDLARLTLAGRRRAVNDTRVLLSFIGTNGRPFTMPGIQEMETQTGVTHDAQDAIGISQTKVGASERSSNFPR